MCIRDSSIYVDKTSTATRLIAGVYTDNNGHPGKLITGWDDTWIKVSGWNEVRLPVVPVAAGTKYWIAVLNPTGGLLNILNNIGSNTQPSETNQSVTLSELPSLWVTGTISTNGLLSGYGTGY